MPPPQRRSIRIPDYDYSHSGAYFITIVTHQRALSLGIIQESIVQLSQSGRIAEYELKTIGQRFPHAELTAFVIMPNHIHALIFLHPITEGSGESKRERFGKPVSGSITTIVRSYKANVTQKTNRIVPTKNPFWQRGYYEHVIRTQDEHERIYDYIVTNPQRWQDDQENPAVR